MKLQTTDYKLSRRFGRDPDREASGQTSNGFTVIYAALFAGLMIAIGVSIYTIAIKELVLSSASRESQFAFYAADTGIECAQYWDFHGQQDVSMSVFATSTAKAPQIGEGSGKVFCNTADIVSNTSGWAVSDVTIPNSGVPKTMTRFQIQFSPEPYCTVVEVTKTVNDPINFPSQSFTDIKAHGYNTCDSTDPQRVERGIETTYTTN